MKTFIFTLSFMQTVATEIVLRNSLTCLWELYCSAKKTHATSAYLNSLRFDIQDTVAAIRVISNF